MDASTILELLAELSNPSADTDQIKEIESRLTEIKSDPNSLILVLELLNTSTKQSVIWYAYSVIKDIIYYLWVPRSMNPDPSTSPLSSELKMDIRQFFLNFFDRKIESLDTVCQNFIYKLIVSMMKVDFSNEGEFWMNYAKSSLSEPKKRSIGLKIYRFLSDELQSFVDHSITSKTKKNLREIFISIVPEICEQVVMILQNSQNDPEDPSNVEAFVLLRSFLLWISPIYISAELVGTIFTYSTSSKGSISLEAHRCVHALFDRCDVVSVHPVEFRAQLLQIVFEFFQSEMCQFGSESLSVDYIQSLLQAFQPFAANYFFKEDTFDPDIVVEFLTNFHTWTWATFGTSNFSMMIEIWGDLFHGQEGSKFWSDNDITRYRLFFINLVENCLDAMVSPDCISQFTEDDFYAIGEVINEIAQKYPEELCRLVHRATATAINNNLSSIFPLLSCFFHVILNICDDDPVNESISDSLLRYLNELMTKDLPVDIHTIFPIVQNIIKKSVRKFSKNSLHFDEKVFHILKVSVNYGPDFVQPMLELMLETVKIYRPMNSCKKNLSTLMDMQAVFCEMSIQIYSLYLCCCETMAAYVPIDCVNKPLCDGSVIGEIFALVFENLSSADQMQFSLKLMRDAIHNIAFSAKCTKELIFTVFFPYLDIIMDTYESQINETTFGPLLDFIAAFCTIFPTQIAERMSELINRLFAPLADLLPNIAEGSFEQLATLSFLKILYQLSYFRTTASEHQSENIAGFLLTYADSLFHCKSIDIQIICFEIVKKLIIDRWSFLPESIQNQLLHILFFDGVCSEDSNSVKISIDTIMDGHKLYQLLDNVDTEFRFKAFASICNEMCNCTNTSMRESMVDFAVFFCKVAPDFHDLLLIPFINQLPVSESDMTILIQMFDNFKDDEKFKTIFLDFCDDVSYLMNADDIPTDFKLEIGEQLKQLLEKDESS